MSEVVQPATPSTAPPGWYPDPSNQWAIRYWDGWQWTATSQAAYVFTPPVDPLDVVDGRAFVSPWRAWALGFKQWRKFSGRASRSEFWWWALLWNLTWIAMIAAFSVEGPLLHRLAPACTGSFGECPKSSAVWVSFTPGILLVIALLVMFTPSLAVLVRRLHDAGLSGAWALLAFSGVIFFFFGAIGEIALIILAALPSKPANQYGLPSTKGAPASAR
jgi:uncharacterized membrane protein YhaH (DUF805 family)